MPITVAATDDLVDLRSVKDSFVVFYSSRDANGELWCPDCSAVEEVIQEVFGHDSGPSALIVYVGQKSEWKTPSNQFRGAPWSVDRIPTVIRIQDGEEVARLVENEVKLKLKELAESHGS